MEMANILYPLLADTVVVLHFLFIVYAILGGIFFLKWKWAAALHLPVVAWATLIMWIGWICPLTPLENSLRHRAGQEGYDGGFIEHYLLSFIYPEGLTREIQMVLGLGVFLINIFFYSLGIYLWKRRKRTLQQSEHGPL